MCGGQGHALPEAPAPFHCILCLLLLHARGHRSGSLFPPVGQRHKLAPCKRPALSECTPYRSRPNASAAVRTLCPFPNDTSVCFRSRFTYGMYTYFFRRTRLPPRTLSRLAGILSQESVKSAMSARSARSAKSASTTASNISARLAKAAGASGGAGSGVPSPRATATGRARGGSPRAGTGASRPVAAAAAAREAAAGRDKELRSMKSPRAGTKAMGGRTGWL